MLFDIAEDQTIDIADDEKEVTIAFQVYGRPYRVLFRDDGTGALFDDDRNKDGKPEHEFNHNLSLPALLVEHWYEPLYEYLEEYFWNEVNPNIENRLVKESWELERHELEFVMGNRNEFERLMRLFLLTEPETALRQSGNYAAIVKSASKPSQRDSDPEPHLSLGAYRSDRLLALTQLLFREHYPRGYYWEYNDGPSDRLLWGYSFYAEEFDFPLAPILAAPAREKMAARAELCQWLTERGHNPADYGLIWEKII
jgi:hypothetical protein